jgi:hypothetical protein
MQRFIEAGISNSQELNKKQGIIALLESSTVFILLHGS